MKSLIFVLSMVVTLKVLAVAPTDYVEVEGAEKAKYISALAAAMEYKTRSECAGDINKMKSYGDRNSIAANMMDLYGALLINKTGQPVFVFRNVDKDSQKVDEFAYVTSADYKSVIKVITKTLALRSVNKGDLLNPIMVDEYIETTRGECKIN